MRPDATAYGEVRESVDKFNKEISNFLDEKIMNDPAYRGLGVIPKTYFMIASTLQQHRRLGNEHVIESGNLSNFQTLKPIIRSRLLQATNVENARLEDEMGIMVKACGVTEGGDKINAWLSSTNRKIADRAGLFNKGA